MDSCRPLISRFVVILIASLPAFTQVAILSHNSANTWQLTGGEKILINGKNKIRTGAADEYKKMQTEPIGQVVLRSNANGCLAYRAGNGWVPVYPDGAQVKGAPDCKSLWQSARIQVFTDKNTKNGTDIKFADVFAILPGSNPAEAAVEFLLAPSNFNGAGEKDEAASFEERMSLLIGIAGLTTDPVPTGRLKALLLTSMQVPLREADLGMMRYETLQEGLRYADVSERAFPVDPDQKRVRDQLRATRKSVDQRVAILKALGAGGYWDPLIDKYGDFERFDNSFPDVRTLLINSFQKSAAAHVEAGKRLRAEKQYLPAMQEFKLALVRQPGDKATSTLLDTVRVEEARDHARRVKVKALDVKSPEYSQIRRSLTFAENYIRDGKLKDAESEIAGAEALDKNLPQILLIRAKLYQARNELPKALEMLDAYDRTVIEDKDIDEGNNLRDKILYDLKANKEKIAVQLPKAEAEGNYAEALAQASLGVQLDPNDPQLLYHAGLDAAILRQEDKAKDYLSRYMKVSQALPSEAKTRAEILAQLAILDSASRTSQTGGHANWFSGYSAAAGAFYCPVSLVADVKPAELKLSHKQTVVYNWRNGQLFSVATTGGNPGEAESTVYFDYFPDGKAVRRLDTKPFPPQKQDTAPPRLTPAGAIGDGPGTYFVLFNHPKLNPYLAEKLTGKRVAVVVAGNPYFHPFVWTGIRTFLAEYDSSGHVMSAKEINAKNDAAHQFVFEWDGDRLLSIRERSESGAQGDYSREMHYSDGRIVGETVTFRGKSSKIEYRYEGAQMVEAICDADASIDGRSRRVIFQR